jgi:chromatin structure-remodeling complex subunit RSC9
MAMNSEIQSELDWALGALLRVSYRSPDNLQLVDNQNLAQVLLDRISCAFFFKDGPVIDMSSSFSITDDQAVEYHRVLEALLIMRNVSLDPKNCQFLANQWQCREIVLKGLMLPFAYGYGEVRNHCLEILESISFHLVPDSSSLFSAIVHILSESDDRGLIIPALRSISRLVIRDEQNIIFRIPDDLLSKIMRYLILDDEELISASLDFLYQYTAYASNTSSLLSTPFNVQVCITHLIRLLSYGIEEPKLEYVRLPRQKAPANPPKLNDEILAELLEFSEPDRATYWIRTAYEADPDGEVTQISLWKAYEAQFEEHARHGKKLLPAVDFIKNVTSAFRNSAAMVVVLPDGTKRFIIKGMKPREYPLPPSVAQNQEEVGKLVKQQREPTRFGVTAALVLQNMAKCKEGFSLLESNVHLLIRSIQLNPTVASYIESLLDKFHSTDEDAAEITSM